MFGTCGRLVIVVALVALCVAPASAQPVSFTGNLTQNFDSMGAAGTAPPSGFSVFNVNPAGSTNTTWNNTTGVGGGVPVSGGTASSGLTAMDAPAANNNNGYNAIGASGQATDRAIATAPTTNAGNAIELSLTNGTGVPLPGLRIAYDIVRYLQVATDNELPGYWLFYSLDNGTTFTNVSAVNPTIAGPGGVIVPNSIGVTSVPFTNFLFSAPVGPGQGFLLRWVDDNAEQTSPDQIISLDNLRISPVPEPSSFVCLAAVSLLAGTRVIRRRFRRAVA